MMKGGVAGMRPLSQAGKGGFQILGFAGDSPTDHIDHYFALDDFFERLESAPERKTH